MDRRKLPQYKDIVGQVFSYLTAISYVFTKNKKAYWLFRCKCGKEVVIVGATVRNGHSKSCGCYKKEVIGDLFRTHGFSTSDKVTKKFYQSWKSIKSRCYFVANKEYPNYGGRGITVCDRWLNSFENFRDDMYESYLKHIQEFGKSNTSLDRLNPNFNYCKENCRWASNSQQARNTRVSARSPNFDAHIKWRKYLSSSLSKNLSRNCKESPTMAAYMGVSLSEFRQHIESQFTEGMSWDNYGRGKDKWNLDHIVGCNNFDLSKEEDRLKCFHYTNLRPMWEIDHKKKSILVVSI